MQSAGLLMYRRRGGVLQVFLVHPGGPFWAKRDLGVWSIPKGGYERDEMPLAAAQREFTEETGFRAEGTFVALGSVTYRRGKVVSAWAVEGDCDPAKLRSLPCTIEWPPHSGRSIEIPEIDRGGWFSVAEAKRKILPAQAPFLERLRSNLGYGDGAGEGMAP